MPPRSNASVALLCLAPLCLALGACTSNAELDRSNHWHGRTAGMVDAELRHDAAQLTEGWLEKATQSRADGYLRYVKLGRDDDGSAEEGWYALRKRMRAGPHYYGRIVMGDSAPQFCALSSRRTGFCENGECTTVVRWDDCTTLTPR